MGYAVNVEIQGLRELTNSFKLVDKGLVDLRQLGTWDWVQSEYYKVVAEQFASEGAAGKSGKWKPLSLPYAELKVKKYGDLPILQASGRMYRSLTSDGSDSYVEKTPQTLALGSTLDYAGFHQTGTSRMPKREVLSFTRAQEDRIVDPIAKKLKQLIANAKLRDLRGF